MEIFPTGVSDELSTKEGLKLNTFGKIVLKVLVFDLVGKRQVERAHSKYFPKVGLSMDWKIC